MSTISLPAEGNVILTGVSWEEYEQLLDEHPEASGTHFIYDEGNLEIMVLSARHEEPNRAFEHLILLLSEELSIDVLSVGSMTLKRPKLRKGFEPDSAFYIAHAGQLLGHDLDPEIDPAPDLVIEVDVSNSSLPRFPIFAAFGVQEVWRYRSGRVSFYRLEGAKYVEIQSSLGFPPLTSQLATRFIEEHKRLRSTQWARLVREWARSQTV